VLSALVLVAAVAMTAATFAQPGDRSPLLIADIVDSNPNFDIRTFKQDPRFADNEAAAQYATRFAPAPGVSADLSADRIAGVAELEAAFKGVDIEENAALGTTEIVSAAPGTGFLTGPSGDRAGTLRAFLTAHAAAYGLSAAQAGELEVEADYMNPAGNMGWAELRQSFNGIPVFQGYLRGGFTPKGELVRTTGVLATGVDAAALATTPSVSAAQAVALAAASVGWDVSESALQQKAVEGAKVTFDRATMDSDAKAWPVYFPLAPGAVRLSWATEIWGDPDAYYSVIDAETGTLLFRKNMTEYQAQSVTYNVYTSDSPAPGSPSLATPDNDWQAPYVSRVNVTLIGNEGPNTFNNLGWITDGANITDGNNVEAGIDRDGANGVDAPVTGSGSRIFNFSYNPEVDDPLTLNYQRGDVTNMFYWVNRFHDSTYLLGFNEQAFNFQNDNFGRGGLGADRVSAEGQDSSGTNNANFSTPADGGRGRMQMFLWTGPTPDRSGDLDADIILHELTHGLSNRLHGNATGLSTNMARGMGEGWSDFYARSLLSTADENVNGLYTVGGWATNLAAAGYTDNYYYGIRRFPYAPRAVTGGPSNRPHSPLTFADIDSTQADLTDGAYPRGPFGVTTVDQVHNIGEVWAGMLWEVRARFVTRLGHAVGNQRILQYVTDGMKLDPAGPTLIQARDAILAAAAAGGTQADIDDIWTGFATRGLGVLAAVTDAGTGGNNTRVVESYLTPSDPVPSFSIDDVSLTEGNAGTKTFAFTVTLTGASAAEHRVSYATANGTAAAPTPTTQTAVTATSIPAGAPATTVGNAAPYPVTVNVAGMTGTITKLAVRLNGLTHTWPDDIDALLVAPGGQAAMFMSDIGGGGDVNAIDLTFEDGAPAASTSQLVTGTVSPTNTTASESLPAPAPTGPYPTPLSTFNGTNPNGTWSLYVVDDASGDSGSLAGFSLLITTTTSPGDYFSASGELVFPPGTTSLPVNVTVNGDVTPEPNETFFVNLSASINAVIGDNQGVGTIINDDGGGPVPTAANDAYGAAINTAVTVPAPGVLGNDNSNGGGAMTAVLSTGPTQGSLSLAADGGFTYTPNPGYSGPDSFTYFALNPFGAGNVATVSLTVGGLPTTVNDAYSTPYLTTLNITAPGVLGNDNSNGGGVMGAELLSSTSHGTLSLSATGAVSYTPAFGFAGVDSFTYRALNGAGPGNVATVDITVDAPTTVQPPFNLRVDSVVGNTVTLRWDALPIGPQASTFILEGGLNPGEVLASIPSGHAAPIFTFVAPTGSFYIRMHGQLGSDKSAASNEVRLHVNVAVPPSAPANLLGTANGSTMDLAWKNTFGGGAASGLVLDVTGSAVTSLPLGATERFSFAGVPGGTYTFRLRATNAGGASAPSDPVSLSFPAACTGAPEAPANLLAYRLGSTGYVVWDPPAAGSAPTGYVLNVTGAFVGSFATSGRVLSGGVAPGTYNLSLVATNACGTGAPANTVLVVP